VYYEEILLFLAQGIFRGSCGFTNHINTANSLWVFLLLGIEAIKTYRTNPQFTVGTVKVPTWTIPLVVAVLTAILVPHTSFLGHICGLGIGYICKHLNSPLCTLF
jgi:hypothetical protein